MLTKIVEVSNRFNWGKFLLGRFDAEDWKRRSVLPGVSPPLGVSIPLLAELGWHGDAAFLWVLDLATKEGACFRLGGNAKADLEKHRIWVCPMFEPFLHWLYAHREYWSLEQIPDYVELTGADAVAASAMYGHRRPGPTTLEALLSAADRMATLLEEGNEESLFAVDAYLKLRRLSKSEAAAAPPGPADGG